MKTSVIVIISRIKALPVVHIIWNLLAIAITPNVVKRSPAIMANPSKKNDSLSLIRITPQTIRMIGISMVEKFKHSLLISLIPNGCLVFMGRYQT